MDTKRLIVAMVVMTALILGWGWFTEFMYQRNPDWRRPGETAATTQPVAPPTTAPDNAAPVTVEQPTTDTTTTTTTAPAVGITTAPTVAPAVKAAPAGTYRAIPATAQTLVIGSDARSKDSPIKMAITLTTTGAGIDRVTLNEFDAADQSGKKPQDREHYTYQHPFNEFESLSRPLATTGLKINGQKLNLANVAWKLVSSTETSADFSLDILSADRPVARLHKSFTLTQSTDPGLGYQVVVDQKIENLTGAPLTIQATTNGPIPPAREILNHDDRQILAGYNIDGKFVVTSHYPAAFTKDKPVLELTADAKGNRFHWFGASSVYFNALIRPENPAQFANISAVALNPEGNADDRLVVMDFSTNELTIALGASESVNLSAFFGPKQREVLNTEYYTALGYDHTLGTLNSGCANWCTHPIIINSLVWLLGAFHYIFRDWGIAIICLVVVVRTLLHPITKRSTISMHKMGKMGPEMERLKKKYADNKEELNKAMMQMYKQQGATPILGCLPMFLQMPIWIALWSALQNTFQLRQAGFLHFGSLHLTWIDDLSQPDQLFSWTPFPLMFGFKLGAINILPILMGVVFYLQQKFTPKPAAATPEQAQQQKMMLWMTVLLFPLFLYNGPSGLNLYILTSTTIGILEMRRIRTHIQEREEKEKIEGPTKVEVSQSRMGKKLARERGPVEPEKKGLAKWLADLQQKAEDMKNQQKKN